MSTINRYQIDSIGQKNPIFSPLRVIIETAFYGNNTRRIKSLEEAYFIAQKSPGIIVTDMRIHKSETLGLPREAKILLANNGEATGRKARARVVRGKDAIADSKIDGLVRQAIYEKRGENFLKTSAYIGLDAEFMVKARLMIPETEAYLLYSWLLNFQATDSAWEMIYHKSPCLPQEGDILVYVDPNWQHPDHPDGLAYFDPDHNAVAILGMSYFGELKKGTLTFAWATAHRNGYLSCHGGLKRFRVDNYGVDQTTRTFVAAFFGLSGTGKSTLTHAAHGEEFDVTVLHDDAFIINAKTGTTIALEPSYFDKTQDYRADSPDNKYILTAQNMGATVDSDGQVVLVTEDIRNKNGRAIKSKLWSPNRVDRIDEKINAIFWLMKDSTLPPVTKVKSAVLAAAMGLTLMTKRSSAEALKNQSEYEKSVIVPYANPFRIYPVSEDYEQFKALFTEQEVDCYILNTGDFMGKKITPECTLGCIESLVMYNAVFTPFGPLPGLEMIDLDGFKPDFDDTDYVDAVKRKFTERKEFLADSLTGEEMERAPEEALQAIERVLEVL